MSIADVLVVDGDSCTREVFGAILREAECGVCLAETGDQALRLARTFPPALVVCDLHLPDATALDVLRSLRRSAIEAPFVVMTSVATVASVLEAGRLGVVDYLEKPVTPERLLGLVAQHGRSHYQAASNSHAARARRVIEMRYADPDLSLQAAARALGLSPQHVCRILRQHAGLTFANLLRTVRLREARRLLGDSADSMKAIAYQVGFRHPSQFTRAFQHDCGISPSEYRRRRTGHHSDDARG
jgi:YesN/AraC family two-component response regulator